MSFAPGLPTSFSTEQAREAFQYAYVEYRYRQSPALGGSLTLLSSNDLLELADFARFEVQSNALSWRLERTSARHYLKELSLYDEDESNDPSPAEACVSDDIQGVCACEFEGPAILVTLDGMISQ